jgi:hypothetical protein
MYGAKTQAQKCTGQVTMWFEIKLKNGADKANGGGGEVCNGSCCWPTDATQVLWLVLDGYIVWQLQFWLFKSQPELRLIFGTGSRSGIRNRNGIG